MFGKKRNISFNTSDLGFDLTHCILSNAQKSGYEIEIQRTGDDARASVKGLTDEDVQDLEGYVQHHTGKKIRWGKGK